MVCGEDESHNGVPNQTWIALTSSARVHTEIEAAGVEPENGRHPSGSRPRGSLGNTPKASRGTDAARHRRDWGRSGQRQGVSVRVGLAVPDRFQRDSTRVWPGGANSSSGCQIARFRVGRRSGATAARADIDHGTRHAGAHADAAQAEVHPDARKKTNGTPKPKSHEAPFPLSRSGWPLGQRVGEFLELSAGFAGVCCSFRFFPIRSPRDRMT